MSLHHECQKVNSKSDIVITDASQGSTAKHLSYDGLLYYKFIIQLVG